MLLYERRGLFMRIRFCKIKQSLICSSVLLSVVVGHASSVYAQDENLVSSSLQDSVITSQENDNVGGETSVILEEALEKATADQNTQETTQEDAEVLEEEVTILQDDTKLSLEDYQKASATELAQWVKEGKVTPEELVELAFNMIEQTNPELNNVITTRKAQALEELQQIENKDLPFYGVPILVKGLGHTVAGGENSLGIEFLKDVTSRSTGRYVRKFQELGFVVIGQTSYPQYGWINVTNSDLFGDTANPWDETKNPGGSSGGSAAAVAIGQVPVATSSDGGGSTRIPASWSGLIGLHPTRGVTFGTSGSERNQVSHFALTRNMVDTQQLFELLLEDEEKLSDKTLGNTPLKIAYTTHSPANTPVSQDAIAAVKEAVDFLKAQGFELIEVEYPIDGKKMMESYYIIAASNASAINYQATRVLKRPLQKDDVELLTWALYQTSQSLERADVDRAWEYVRELEQQLEQFYRQYDVFLTPSTATTAPAANYHHIPEDLVEQLSDMSNLTKEEKLALIYEQWLPAWTLTPYTQLSNLTGTPSLSLPTYLSQEGLPLGILINGNTGADRLLLQLGNLFEQNQQLKFYYRDVYQTLQQEIPIEVIVIEDDTLKQGEEMIEEQGSVGLLEEVYQVSMAGNNKLTSPVLVTSKVIVQMQPRVVRQGVGISQSDERNEEHDATSLKNTLKDTTTLQDDSPQQQNANDDIKVEKLSEWDDVTKNDEKLESQGELTSESASESEKDSAGASASKSASEVANQFEANKVQSLPQTGERQTSFFIVLSWLTLLSTVGIFKRKKEVE